MTASTPATAAPGNLVDSFGSGGLVTTGFDRAPSRFIDLERQANGRLVGLAVNGAFAQQSAFLLAGYQPNGSLDSGFGEGGLVATSFTRLASASALALAPDDKLVVAGSADDQPVVARYTSNGALDGGFASAGRRTDIGPLATVADVAVQNDGKILLSGDSDTETSIVVRLNSDGSADTSFGVSGVATVGDERQRAAAMSIAPGGAILTGGIARMGTTDPGLTVQRLTPSGQLDASFASDGSTTIDASSDRVSAVLGLPDGSVLLGGTSGNGGIVVKLTASGSVDSNFSPNRNGIMPMPAQRSLEDLTLDGTKIVAVGGALAQVFSTAADFTVMRLNADGSRDGSFSGDGVQSTDFGAHEVATAVSVEPGGSIVAVGGEVPTFAPYLTSDAKIARYTANGDLDQTFAGDGTRVEALPGSDDVQVVLGSADRRVTVVGTVGAHTAGFARYTGNGALDPTFGIGGRALVNKPSPLWTIGPLLKVDAAGGPGGSTAFVATWRDDLIGPSRSLVGRLTAAGQLDTTFGQNGLLELTNDDPNPTNAIAVQPDGKLVVAESGPDFSLTRFSRDGTEDASFGAGGSVSTDIGAPTRITSVALQADGRIVAAGSSENGGAYHVVRYLPDGTPDVTFSGDGIAIVAVPARAVASAVAVGPDARIVVTGGEGWRGSVETVRLGTDGALDGRFPAPPITGVRGADVLVTRAGRTIVTAEAVFAGGSPSDLMALQYTAQGELDPAFGSSGVARADFAGRDDMGGAVAMRSDGTIALGGGATTSRNRDFGVAILEQSPGDGPIAAPIVPADAPPSDAAPVAPAPADPAAAPPAGRTPSGVPAPAAAPAVRPRPSTPSCRPPRLTGRSLAVARRALSRAACRLGKVSRPMRRGRATALVVRSQRLRAGGRVDLVLRAKAKRRRR